MKKVFVLACTVSALFAADAPMDCSMMAPEMQQFAGQLMPENRMVFCGKMTDAERVSAMQMASTMTPDQAVQKVSGPSGAAKPEKMPPEKMPVGCPIK